MKLQAALQVDCNIPYKIFWELTWAQIIAYLTHSGRSMTREDFRVGALILNIRGLFKKQTSSPLDIWPWHSSKTQDEKEVLRKNLKGRASFKKESR